MRKLKTYILPFLILCVTACDVNRYSSSGTLISSTPNGFVIKESVQKFAEYKDYSVAIIVNCGQGIVNRVKTYNLLADNNGKAKDQNLSNLNFSGWNHTTNGNVTEWGSLKLSGDNYNFYDNAKANSSCNNVSTLDIVLLKKIADWNHQHANGFECNILEKGYKFSDVENLVFDLKINSTKTKIPSVESIKNTYVNYVNGSVVDVLEDGKVNIGITLGDSTNLNGSIIFQLDQDVLSDKWVRVTIPMNKLSFYQEISYKKTSKTFEDLSTILINRILIMGETKSGAVLRNNIDAWSTDIPEAFKEMDLSFKKIELQLK